VTRFLVLFAREPAREAREKGFACSGAVALFAGFAAGWREAAVEAGARLVVATPSEDLAAWRRRFSAGLAGADDVLWLSQRGRSFGERLRETARDGALVNGATVFVGGDVPPDAEAALRAFEGLEAGADAVLSPAPDGGVSLLALSSEDHDLFARIAAGSRSVFRMLTASLDARGRRCLVLASAADVDRRLDLRRILRGRLLARVPRSALRAALARVSTVSGMSARSPRVLRLFGPSGLRAPPALASA
jgi:glycosyltransferase A (GT-A) superfamily protein (DUF2064 family)